MKKEINKKKYKAILDDVCSDNCKSSKHCILKEFLISAHPSPRLLIQLKCIDKFKEQIKQKEGLILNNNEGMKKWIEDGYADKFAVIYDENLKFIEIYNLLMT